MYRLISIKFITIAIVSVLIIVSLTFLGTKKYINYMQVLALKEKTAQELQQQKDLEMEKLKQEVETLKNKKPDIIKQTILKESQSKYTDDITAIINQWRPRVAYIECTALNSKNKEIGGQSGTGYILGVDIDSGKITVLTNNHVIDIRIYYTDGTPSDIVVPPTSCDVKIPGDSSFSTAYYSDKGTFSGSKEMDFGLIGILKPTTYMRQVIDTNGGPMCKTKAVLGEKILILGYPGIGDQNDITVTDGIISGYDGDYYITSAKVEHGNSGGVAISLKNNCFLGIPTFVQVGSVESLARILDVQAIFK